MKLRGYSDNAYELVLIRSSAIGVHFDQHDLACRQNPERILAHKYHINWIHRGVFSVPSFWIKDGKAFVGNGRHRFALLSQHMPELPAGFEGIKDGKKESLDVYDLIVVRALRADEAVEFPDLPIEYLGDDVNGEPTWKEWFEPGIME